MEKNGRTNGRCNEERKTRINFYQIEYHLEEDLKNLQMDFQYYLKIYA